MKRRWAWLVVAGALPLAVAAAAEPAPVIGAEVDESKVTKTYFVDPSNADSVDDADHGTEEAPFKTIGRAVLAACADQDRGTGVKVVIADGVYREAVRLGPAAPASPNDVPLVIEAANREQAIIDGADLLGWELASWKQEGANWSHPLAGLPPAEPTKRPAPHAPCKPLPGGVLVFLSGQALMESAEPAAMAPGRFCVVSPLPELAKSRRIRPAPAPATGFILIQSPDPDAMASAPLEVSAREGGVAVEGRRNVVIRGITVQHVGNGVALDLRGCANVLIDDVLCQWNGDAGLRIAGRTTAPWSSGVTVRRVRLLYNGGSGLAASNLKNLVVEDSETSFNGVRGKWSECIDPAGAAGCRLSGIHGGAWRRHHAIGNSARGLWWAGDCSDIAVDDSFARANLISGIFIENSAGPFTVRHCVVTGTRSHPSVRGDEGCPAGVSISAAADVRLEGNVIAGNEMPQLSVWDVAQRNDTLNFETGAREAHRAERHVYRQNVICGLDAEQPVFSLPMVDRGSKAPFDFYYDSLEVSGNCYWNPAQTEVFCSFDKGNNRRPGIDLAGWKTFLGKRAPQGKTPENESVWADPMFGDPVEGDFRLKAGSPAADWGLPADEGTPGG